jgi:hypothetical protein
MFAIYTFIISLLGIIALLALKSWELERGRTTFSQLRVKADDMLRQLSERLYRTCAWINRDNLRSMFRLFVSIMKSWYGQAAGLVKGKQLRIVGLVKGRGIIKKNGRTSSFLRRIEVYRRKADERNDFINKEKIDSL